MAEKKLQITEQIKSFADAIKATGRPDAPSFSDAPEDMRAYLQAQYKMAVITEALNEGWKPDWENVNELKWRPWFWMSSSGFAFDGSYCACSSADAGSGSRLCFRTEALADYAGTQFIDIWNDVQLK